MALSAKEMIEHVVHGGSLDFVGTGDRAEALISEALGMSPGAAERLITEASGVPASSLTELEKRFQVGAEVKVKKSGKKGKVTKVSQSTPGQTRLSVTVDIGGDKKDFWSDELVLESLTEQAGMKSVGTETWKAVEEALSEIATEMEAFLQDIASGVPEDEAEKWTAAAEAAGKSPVSDLGPLGILQYLVASYVGGMEEDVKELSKFRKACRVLAEAEGKDPAGDLSPFKKIDGLKIVKVKMGALGANPYVDMTFGDFKIEAAIYPIGSKYGIKGSRISKLWIKDGKGKVVVTYDRGWDTKPEGDELNKLVDALVKAANDKSAWLKAEAE